MVMSRAELPVARVDALSELLLGGDPGEQVVQLLPLGAGERGADVVVVRGSGRPEFVPHERGPLVGQVKGVVTAVVGVAPALNQAAPFEIVDEEHEPAGRGAQPAGDDLLALPGLHAHQAEQPCLGRREIEAGDPLGEARRGVRADLGQEKSGGGALPGNAAVQVVHENYDTSLTIIYIA
jgi:hypothetical protein